VGGPSEVPDAGREGPAKPGQTRLTRSLRLFGGSTPRHDRAMSSDVTVLPLHGEVFTDARGGDRTLRVNWHGLDGPNALAVLSLWRGARCVGTFRLRARDALLLIDVLAQGAGGSPTPGAGWYEGRESWPPDEESSPPDTAARWRMHRSTTWPPRQGEPPRRKTWTPHQMTHPETTRRDTTDRESTRREAMSRETTLRETTSQETSQETWTPRSPESPPTTHAHLSPAQRLRWWPPNSSGAGSRSA